jgi:hypothetical protein
MEKAHVTRSTDEIDAVLELQSADAAEKAVVQAAEDWPHRHEDVPDAGRPTPPQKLPERYLQN